MKKIAFLTSGGDAPGMNAAIRSIVRVAIARGLEPVAIRRGYEGLLAGDFQPMGLRDVSNIIQRGLTGTKHELSRPFAKGCEGRDAAEETVHRVSR